MYSILFIGIDPALTVIHSHNLISRGFSVVNVSHASYADPIFHSARFDAVILCDEVTESLSKRQLTQMISRFGDSPVLIFTAQATKQEEPLVPVWRPRHLQNNSHTREMISDLQAVFRVRVPVPGSLQSWKEISAYMNRGIRTLQRWEKDFGLPIHRPSKHDRSAVFALIPEIDDWMRRSGTRDRIAQNRMSAGISEPSHPRKAA
ncbi:MAG: hypothetical protein JWO13_3607 [Acidobacteriales bacterium]|nr:hypothetical protein [Terriglobales bacterium]